MTREPEVASCPQVIRTSAADLASETWHHPFTDVVGRGVVRMALDLSEVETLGTLQFARLSQLTRQLRRTGGDLHLFALRPHARRLLTTTVPGGTFSIYDSEEEAVSALLP